MLRIIIQNHNILTEWYSSCLYLGLTYSPAISMECMFHPIPFLHFNLLIVTVSLDRFLLKNLFS